MVRNIHRKCGIPAPEISRTYSEDSGFAARSHAMRIRFSHPKTLSFLVLLVFFATIKPVWAQKDAGAIVGLVRDASGAVVGGAKVTVEDVERGIQLTSSTNDQGEYVA